MASKGNPIILLLFSLIHLETQPSCAQNVKGAYWYPDSEVALSDIDSTHFTHLFFAFVNLDNNTNQVIISSGIMRAFTTGFQQH